MSVQITRTEPRGDGTVSVWGLNPGGKVAHVVVGLDKVADGSAYAMLQLAADKADRIAASLDRQSTLDSEADS